MIDNKFTIVKKLGYGCSSNVYLVEDPEQVRYAVKVIRKDKNYQTKHAEVILAREHEILDKLSSHPNFIKSYHANQKGQMKLSGETSDVMYNIIEYADNGTLANIVRHTGAIEENIVRLFMAQICHSIEYMHNLGFAHLDIKLENILLDELFNIKIADLGSSVDVSQTEGFTNLKRGTKHYIAPEVDNADKHVYNAKAADIYTLGITLYLMLTGEFPTEKELGDNSDSDNTQEDGESDSSSQKNNSAHSIWNNLSFDVKTLIQWMTDPLPEYRPSITDIVDDCWFSDEFSDQEIKDAYEEMRWRKEYISRNFRR